MGNKISLAVGLFMIVGAVAQQSADVVITMPITIEGNAMDLQLRRGQSFEDAAFSFIQTHDIKLRDQAQIRDVVGQLSGMLAREVETKGGLGAITNANVNANAAPPSSVQIAIPLTLNGNTYELTKREDESVDAAAERFLLGTGFAQEQLQEIFPQVRQLLEHKLNELQPPKKELFSISFTIEGRQAIARHFEDGNPIDEGVQTLRSVGIQDAAALQRLGPQIANAISRRIAEMNPPAAPPQPSAPTPHELFSMPLTINNQQRILVHYEGQTAQSTALRFLSESGITDPGQIQQLQPQIVQIVDNRMNEMLRQEAEVQAAAQAQTEAATPAPTPREAKVRLPINIGNNQQAILEYFEGNSIERTAESFLARIGMQDGPDFDESAQRLAGMIRQELESQAAKKQQEQQSSVAAAQPAQAQPVQASESTSKPREPSVRLTINIGNNQQAILEYFEGDSIEHTAESFLARLGMQNDPAFQQNVQQLAGMVRQELEAKAAQQASSEPAAEEKQDQQQQQETATESKTASRPGLLFSIPLTLRNTAFTLDYFAGQTPNYAATAFCVEKYEMLRSERGIEFDNDQLVACRDALVGVIKTKMEEHEKAAAAAAEEPEAAASADPFGLELFRLYINVDEKSVPLIFREHDDPEQVVAAFCNEHGILKEHSKSLLDALNNQLARMNRG